MTDMDLDEAVATLYALPVEQFLTRRAELVEGARGAGDAPLAAEIGRLRKPTAAAWAVNLFSRVSPHDTRRLRELAAGLRAAQSALDGPALARLGKQRSALVDELTAATCAAAQAEGVSLSAATVRLVTATYVAALASAPATAAVLSGRLTRALEYAGFGDVDLTDATARPLRAVPALPVHDVEPDPAVRPAADADALATAEAGLRQAMTTATEAASTQGVLVAQADLAHTRVTHLERELAQARDHRDRTAAALAEGEAALTRAEQAVAAARAALEALRAP